jgi:hypothetical protein
MSLELVTGYWGEAHVTAEQEADRNRAIWGDAAILDVGSGMVPVIQTANQITIPDGIAVYDGRLMSIAYGETENVSITSGTTGKVRNDIIVIQYTRDSTTGI